MKDFWKQFAERVTGLRDNLFEIARWKLTAFYIILSAVILAVFSFALYHYMSGNLRENLDGQFEDEILQAVVIEQTMEDLRLSIAGIDLTILLLVAILGYGLAGRTLKPIKIALEAQKQFSSSASHELRTPLAIMKTENEVTLRNPASGLEDFKRLSLSNLEEIERMSDLVENLLALARSERADRKDFGHIDISLEARGVLEKMQGLAAKKKITLRAIRLDNAFIRGNAVLIGQMVMNLLQNAMRHTMKGGTVDIAIKKSERVEMVISDNGTGIEPKHLPHIFERFYAASPFKKGNGIGLAVVKEIADAHKAVIDVQSAPGKGTKVKVAFPKPKEPAS